MNPHLKNWKNWNILGDISKIRFSYKNDYTNEKIIIIDSIGILLTLYYYAEYCIRWWKF